MTKHPWESIELAPHEKIEYLSLCSTLSLPRDYSTIVTASSYSRLEKILASDEYSFDFKMKLAFQRPHLDLVSFWACETLKGDDLGHFVYGYLGIGFHVMTEKAMVLLASNVSFVNSIAFKSSAIKQCLYAFAIGGMEKDPLCLKWGNILIENIINVGSMNIEIAELTAYLITEFSGPIGQLEARHLVEWTRNYYNFGEATPDSWVLKFLSEIQPKKLISN